MVCNATGLTSRFVSWCHRATITIYIDRGLVSVPVTTPQDEDLPDLHDEDALVPDYDCHY